LLGEKLNKIKLFFLGSIFIMFLSQTGLYLIHSSIQYIALMLVLFFTAFNYLEAALPSLITKVVSSDQKGTALGIYTTSQFIGTFTGGLLGGYIYEIFNMSSVFLSGAIIAMVWLVFTIKMPEPVIIPH